MAAALNEYLTVGGLPEVVLADMDLRPRILKEYVDLVFYKDLVERYKVANPALLRQLLKQCLGQPASLLRPHKIYKDFRSQGYELSKDRYVLIEPDELGRQCVGQPFQRGVRWGVGHAQAAFLNPPACVAWRSTCTTWLTKMAGVTMVSGSSAPSATTSCTLAMVRWQAMAMLGPKLRAVLR